MSDSLQSHGLQYARLPRPLLSPGICSNSCALSWCCYPTISSSVALCYSCLQSFSASGYFFNELALHTRWPKYWCFSFSISSSNENPGLIFFRMDLLDLLAVQGTLRHLLQHYNSEASIFRCSVFFIVQLSHPYMTNGKNHSLD